ncbi:unnamed protein product [Cunninghamella blakesleeana]
MSDDDFMLEDDEQDYDFDYEDDEDEEPDVDLENKYYNAKARKEDDPEGAITEFQSVVDTEEEKGEWGFKALKQMAKISFHLTDMKTHYGTIKNCFYIPNPQLHETIVKRQLITS